MAKRGQEKKSSMRKAFCVKEDLLHRKEGFFTKLQIQEQEWPSLCMEESQKKILVAYGNLINETLSHINHPYFILST